MGRRPARVTLKGAEVQLIRLCRQFAASGECNELRRVAVRRVGWQRTARLCESQKLGLFSGRDNSLPPARTRPSLRELQYAAWGGGELRGSTSHRSSANSSTQSKAHPTAPCSAWRGGKTVTGFPARRTVTAQSTAQFSAPCAPHCGSAFAPPHLPRVIVELCSARLGNLVKTRKRILTISLFRRRRAIRSLPRIELFLLASRCLRLPRATSAKPVNGLCFRNATRFLLAARQFANFVCIALAGSVGCEQREPEKL